jgi:malic enzyme
VIKAWLFSSVVYLAYHEDLVGAGEGVVLLGAVVAALGIIHVKMVRPCLAFFRKGAAAIDVMLDMVEWKEDLEDRLDRVERQQNGLLAALFQGNAAAIRHLREGDVYGERG